MRNIAEITKRIESMGKFILQDSTGFAAKIDYHGADLRIICSWGGGWDHVSISLRRRCPFWPEMSMVRDICFEPDEVEMQLHPAAEDYVNVHPFCLHLWRPQGERIPMPPKEMV